MKWGLGGEYMGACVNKAGGTGDKTARGEHDDNRMKKIGNKTKIITMVPRYLRSITFLTVSTKL